MWVAVVYKLAYPAPADVSVKTLYQSVEPARLLCLAAFDQGSWRAMYWSGLTFPILGFTSVK
jgi:hypothetical protein